MTTPAARYIQYHEAISQLGESTASKDLRRALQKTSHASLKVDDIDSLSTVAKLEELELAARDAEAFEIVSLIQKVLALPAAVRQTDLLREFPELAGSTASGSNFPDLRPPGSVAQRHSSTA